MAQQGAPRIPQALWRARRVRAFMLAMHRSRQALRVEARARLYKARTAPIRGRVDPPWRGRAPDGRLRGLQEP